MRVSVLSSGLLLFTMAYKNFYIQKMKEGAPVKESVSDFSLWCKEFPFQLMGKIKELPYRNWPDEHGEDEYIPNNLFLEADEIEVEMGYKGPMESANEKIKFFLQYLTQDGCEFKIYDAHTRIGRQRVRLVSVSNDGLFVRNESEGDVIVFTVKFKVNDPITDVILSK